MSEQRSASGSIHALRIRSPSNCSGPPGRRPRSACCATAASRRKLDTGSERRPSPPRPPGPQLGKSVRSQRDSALQRRCRPVTSRLDLGRGGRGKGPLHRVPRARSSTRRQPSSAVGLAQKRARPMGAPATSRRCPLTTRGLPRLHAADNYDLGREVRTLMTRFGLCTVRTLGRGVAGFVSASRRAIPAMADRGSRGRDRACP